MPEINVPPAIATEIRRKNSHTASANSLFRISRIGDMTRRNNIGTSANVEILTNAINIEVPINSFTGVL